MNPAFVAADANVLRQLGQHPQLVHFFGTTGVDDVMTSTTVTWLLMEHAALGLYCGSSLSLPFASSIVDSARFTTPLYCVL